MNDNVVYIEGRNRMFDIILRYLYGFAKIHLRGIHINRFVNLCKARDIKLWDLEQKEDEIFFFTASKDIARLEEPARKTESDVEILRVYGIREFIRKNKKSKNDVSLDDTLNYDAEGNELKLSDVVGTEEDIVDRQFQDKMNREFLANEINNLSKRDKEIMMLRYGLNNTKEYTQKEVANMLGISQSYISRIEKKVINEISKVIN